MTDFFEIVGTQCGEPQPDGMATACRVCGKACAYWHWDDYVILGEQQHWTIVAFEPDCSEECPLKGTWTRENTVNFPRPLRHQ